MPAFTDCLVLRLAAPLQSWGIRGQYNRRDTAAEPTKSGIIGLLAAAQGRRRPDPIDDLLGLNLGVRIDQSGSLLRDYHTVSDYRGRPLLSSAVNAKGIQKTTSPVKNTHVTERFYLTDAIFVAAVTGPNGLLRTLSAAMRRPAFPLALGRRSCVPTQPLVIPPKSSSFDDLWTGTPLDVLQAVPWQASESQRRGTGHRGSPPHSQVDLPVTVDDMDGPDVLLDLPRSFEPTARAFTARPVRHTWVRVDNPSAAEGAPTSHDPFALLGW